MSKLDKLKQTQKETGAEWSPPAARDVVSIEPLGREGGEAPKKQLKAAKKGKAANAKTQKYEQFKAYSTYISDSQKKKIKYQAIERGVEMQVIVREALDEYFENHPL